MSHRARYHDLRAEPISAVSVTGKQIEDTRDESCDDTTQYENFVYTNMYSPEQLAT